MSSLLVHWVVRTVFVWPLPHFAVWYYSVSSSSILQHKTRLITLVISTFRRTITGLFFYWVRVSEIILSLIAAARRSKIYFGRQYWSQCENWLIVFQRLMLLMLTTSRAVCHCSILPILWVSIVAVFRILYVCTAWTPSISGLDIAGLLSVLAVVWGMLR